MRVKELFAQQVAARLLKPLGLDCGNATPKQAGGFDQFGAHDPAPGFFAQVCAWVAVKLDAACAQVPVLLVAFAADIAQQAREQADVQLLVAGGCGVELPALLGGNGKELAVDVAPLAHAPHVDEVLAQQGFVLAVAEFVSGWRRGCCGGLCCACCCGARCWCVGVLCGWRLACAALAGR